ncbi:MAG TPA: hypothetical protein VEF34_12355, partial [Syntrophobacteraceae bacterium]|nr:hypothetical protein [Syntrophobacteraceae bacterium]
KMEDEIRVTVIATGIGKVDQKKAVEAPALRPPRRIRPPERVMPVMPVIDYELLQAPPNVRQRVSLNESLEGTEESDVEPEVQQAPTKRRTLLQMITGGGRSHEEEDLSIPTFIRRQAD